MNFLQMFHQLLGQVRGKRVALDVEGCSNALGVGIGVGVGVEGGGFSPWLIRTKSKHCTVVHPSLPFDILIPIVLPAHKGQSCYMQM